MDKTPKTLDILCKFDSWTTSASKEIVAERKFKTLLNLNDQLQRIEAAKRAKALQGED